MRLVCGLVMLTFLGCAHEMESAQRSVNFDPLLIESDQDIATLSDEQLYTRGTDSFRAGDYDRALRYFERLSSTFPNSRLWRQAQYDEGLVLGHLGRWDEAVAQFFPLADAKAGKGDALEAAVQLAIAQYKVRRLAEAEATLRIIAARPDVEAKWVLATRVQLGVVLAETGRFAEAEKEMQAALDYAAVARSPDGAFIAQAHFYLGEFARLKFETLPYRGGATADQMHDALEEKSQRLLVAQKAYIKSIEIKNLYWAAAAGQRLGALYERLYDEVSEAKPPTELSPKGQADFQNEVKSRVRVLVEKAITVYEATVFAFDKSGDTGRLATDARASLARMKALLPQLPVGNGTSP